MKRLPAFKDFDVTPLDGRFDARSPSGKLNFFDFRVVLNMDLTDQRKRCRMGGWQKLMSDSPFGFLNQDLHDQLLGCQSYYETYNETFAYDYNSGSAYPFWAPDQFVPQQVEITQGEDEYLGYAPDFYGDYPYAVTTYEPFICNVTIGAPYESGVSSFFLCEATIDASYTIPGYGYGDPIPNYNIAYQFDREYCGGYAYTREHQCREAITLLYEAVSVGGRRQLVAGTKSRLYVLNQRSGNWRILADGLGGPYLVDDNCGCAARRFQVAQLGNYLILTNDYDPVLAWQMDSGPSGCDLWSVDYIQDLLGLNITKARTVAVWNGFVFLGNVEVSNERHVSRIYWSDLNDPLSWAPGGESVAGQYDLGLGEAVIAMEPIGGQLRVYTTRGDEKAIYEVAVVGGDEVLNFREIYRGPDGLEYANSLVNTGQSHVWLSSSGVMVLGEYDRSPQRLEWIYKADGVFYNGLPSEWVRDFDGLSGFGAINKDECHNVVGGYNSSRKQIWFSWPTDNNECPNMSLVLNPIYQTATLVDRGFTAFAMFRPDYAATLRDFLAEYAGCNPSLFVMPKEGEPIPISSNDSPSYIRNYEEDPDQPVHPDSLCANLTGITLQDLCESCEVDAMFVMADAGDKALKQFTPDQYYRERYVEEGVVYECPDVTPGSYVLDGYYSMLQSDALDFKLRTEKLVNKTVVDFLAEEQTTPSKLYCEIAFGAQPSCLQWDQSATPKLLECLTNRTRRQHVARSTRASKLPSFKFHRRGVYLAWRFYVKGTGGGSCYNAFTWSVRPIQGSWD